MPTTFREATDTLFAPITQQQLADALGVSVSTIRQARLREGAKAYRSPPEGWQEAMANLAETRAGQLDALARALDGEMRKAKRGKDRR